jgi:cobalt-zinc-cadmium efflux system protein
VTHHHDHDHDHDHAHRGHDHARSSEPTPTPAPAARASGHDHAHDHDHAAELRRTPSSRLSLALALTAGFMVVEVVGGVLTHSLALLSDAVHMLTDAGALVLALVAQRIARQRRTARRTYGYRRAETLAAFVNGTALALSSVWILAEAVGRWIHPRAVVGGWMMAVAGVGLAVNLGSAWVLSRGGDGHNANTRAALAHVLADAAGSVAAISAGAAVTFFGWNRADPAISMAMSVLILWGAWKLVGETVDVLMEGAPADVDAARIEGVVRDTSGVADLHDLHAWTVAEGFPVVTVHVVLAAGAHGTEVAREVSMRIERELGIHHVTVQPEAPGAPLIPRESLVRRDAAPKP